MKILYLLLFSLPCGLFSQNLVINPDFESRSDCPSASGQYTLASGWFSPNTGTPDYYNDCSPSLEYGTEYNARGGQLPHSGHGYMGLLMENLYSNEYFEYAETRLKEPLRAGQFYCIKVFVSLGDCNFALDHLGAVLSQNILKNLQVKKIVLPFTTLSNGSLLSDAEKWMCIKGIYKAKGGETFLTIGYFDKEDSFTVVRPDPRNGAIFKAAYYFMEDVSLEPVNDESLCNCTP
jgi:hypothetical protein